MKNIVAIPQHRFIMFCIPKVANSSIKVAILKALGYDDVHPDKRHGHPALNVSTPKQVSETKEWEGFFKAAIVRNPFDRLVSCYEQKIRDPIRVRKQGFAQFGFHCNMTFKQFIRRVREMPFANIHFQPQLPALKHDEEFLPDYVGKFETIDVAWDHIRSRTTLPLLALPHINGAPQRKPYREYYDNDSRQIVEDVFEDDLKAFGYSH